MTGLLLDGRLGAENLQLAFYQIFVEQINTYIAAEEAWAQANIDNVLQSLDGYQRDVGLVDVERFEVANIHYGHRPSMIEAPITEYPSAAVMAGNISPSNLNARADYGHSLGIRLVIEFIVRAGPYREDRPDADRIGEDIVGRRALRTTEAIFKMMEDERSAGGTFLPPDAPPAVVSGDIFIRQEDGASGTGHRWYWKGVRLEWLYSKQTIHGIDQS